MRIEQNTPFPSFLSSGIVSSLSFILAHNLEELALHVPSLPANVHRVITTSHQCRDMTSNGGINIPHILTTVTDYYCTPPAYPYYDQIVLAFLYTVSRRQCQQPDYGGMKRIGSV
jgi:hypothetical protein